jgi:ATP-dependent DNA helicase UvrD/PcrA
MPDPATVSPAGLPPGASAVLPSCRPADLTPTSRQRDAIEAPLGPVLVVAGPGAGKTFCLIERIRRLVAHHGIPASRICAVTFTNKAADEIAHRLAGALGPAAGEVTRSTIHALCVSLLREHGEAIGVPRGFGIADEDYQRLLLGKLKVWEKRRGWILGEFSRHRLTGQPLEPDNLELYGKYREHLDRKHLLDFDDLVVRTEELLRNRPEEAKAIVGRWDYILVDEFQDLNPKQYEVLLALARGHRNLFAVGDDEQSIYAWAGADPRVLTRLSNDLGLTREILLDENRRSSRVIFETARRLIVRNPVLFDKAELRATRESAFPVQACAFDDEGVEAGWIVADIGRDRLEHGLEWGDYALLYRKHEIGDGLEGALMQAGIPCQLAVGRALTDDPVVRYVVAALRFIADPTDPILAENFARVVLPDPVYRELRARADQDGTEFVRVLKHASRQRGEASETIWRCHTTLWNLPSLKTRHESVAGLVSELLSHRVGEYRSPLDEHADELTDPMALPAVTALADRLGRSRHGRSRVWVPRMGGAEIGLAGMLSQGGITMIGYLDDEARPHPEDLVLGLEDGGALGLPLAVFKALQLIRGETFRDVFRDFTAIDVETTDRDWRSCEVVELAGVRVRDGQVTERFQTLVRPEGPVSPAASAVHGYTAEHLVDAPSFADAWSRFRRFAGDDLLVAHNGHHFDFAILGRLARGHPAGDKFPRFDTLPLARSLHPGSRRLEDLAHAFGVPLGRAHHALDDAEALALVFRRLALEKLARSRKTGQVGLLEWLALALAPAEPRTPDESHRAEATVLFNVGRMFALGRYGQALAFYDVHQSHPGVPSLDRMIELLGGRRMMERIRREKSADERYPAAMARLRRLLSGLAGTNVDGQLQALLERVALSQSRNGPEPVRDRVNLLTLHATKGLEFSRVYIVGVEDAQLPGAPPGREPGKREIEEGRRLLYVGMTRAEDRLVMTAARMRGGRPAGGTAFLGEMGLTTR